MFNPRSSALLILLVWFLQISTSYAAEKQKIGWVENVTINGSELQLKAKIDTGATTSSINAKIVKKFTKNGKKWIRFSVQNNSGQTIVLERKIVRYVKIKRKLALPLKRPVVNLGICLGKIHQVLEVNLSDRKNFDYQLLVGRNYLRGHFIVDSDDEYTIKPSCAEKE